MIDLLIILIILGITVYLLRDRIVYPLWDRHLVRSAIRRYQLNDRNDFESRELVVGYYTYRMTTYGAYHRGYRPSYGDLPWKIERARLDHIKARHAARNNSVMAAIKERLPEGAM